MGPATRNPNTSKEHIPSFTFTKYLTFEVVEIQPNVDEIQPSVDEVQPIVDEIQPRVDENQPSVDEIQPSVDEVLPRVGEIQPSSKRDLAEWLELLTANAEVATVLGSIPASSDTVESEGQQC